MTSVQNDHLRQAIIQKAEELEASLAGIASVVSLQNSHSHVKYDDAPYYDGTKGSEWPEEAVPVLVLTLAHDLSDLDNDIPSVAELVSRNASNAEKIIHECLSELSG